MLVRRKTRQNVNVSSGTCEEWERFKSVHSAEQLKCLDNADLKSALQSALESKDYIHAQEIACAMIYGNDSKIPTPRKQDLADALELMKDPTVLARATKKISETLGREVVLPESDGTPERVTARQTALALAIRDYGHVIAKASKQGLAA